MGTLRLVKEALFNGRECLGTPLVGPSTKS